jgi:hypothetical protein
MNARTFISALPLLLLGLGFTGCATKKPYDYTNFRQHHPRSILVLPPLNQSTAVEGTYSYLSTATQPLAEMGYYVFPVAVVDQFLKENGMPGAGEMHQIPLPKVLEIMGADSVLFITLKQYGSKYQVINSATIVSASASLMDTRTGIQIWQGEATAQQNSGGSGNIIADLISAAIVQAINSGTDAAHDVCPLANRMLFTTKNHGLLWGHYHPEFGKTK